MKRKSMISDEQIRSILEQVENENEKMAANQMLEDYWASFLAAPESSPKPKDETEDPDGEEEFYAPIGISV